MSTKAEPLRLLLVEDSDDDAALVLRELKRSHFELVWERVQTAPDLESILAKSWDIVLCDYTMPHLDAPTALDIVRKHSADMPFIVVSGTVGEDTAVEVMRAGANDYLLKGHLTRLVPAITREVRDSRLRAERRRADRARQQAEESFRLIIESSPDLIVVHREGRIVYANPKTVDRLGVGGAAAIVGQPLSKIVSPDNVRTPRAVSTTESGRPAPVEQRWLRQDGSAISVEVVHDDVVFEGTLATVVIARDLTERNQIAAAMIEMDRMAAIGILAAGVGHEINNPLAYVLANLEFVTSELDAIISELPDEAKVRLEARIADLTQALADTNHGAHRVRAIVQDLRTFARGEDAVASLVDVRQILDSSVRMAAVQIRQRGVVERSYEDNLPSVLANESRIGQLFLNLVVNAAQALPEGTPSENRIEIVAKSDGQFVRVEIGDTGSGIPADVLPRIFEPFFTTKPTGQGTGLGLSICRRIVMELGGDIGVTSEPGKGSRFTVHLPRASAVGRASMPAQAQRGKSLRRARILCVDDEAAIGQAIKRVLVAEHDVELVTNASEALARVEAGQRFDLILCDLMMPAMSGMDLHRELMRVAPDVAARVVFLTGGAFTQRARDFLEGVDNPRLEKPIGIDALRNAIAEMLERG
ncbi:MAG: Sensory box histidine kinase/response regulator [Myxococcaceae bacterium]|nr:Sensory box histidine kinase/response regulator [Myxococcaceae bacterium]